MRCLLDSHAFLWFIHGDKRLGERARKAISDEMNQILLSTASLWEIAIKVSLDKLELEESIPDLVSRWILGNRIQLLTIEPRHIFLLTNLAFHHRDPFDRMIIAQAIVEGIPVVSGDGDFRKYPVQILW
jgi:PIN domain nuclease of toxin-antitoxin system